MSLISWLFPKKKRSKPGHKPPASSGLSRLEPTRPAGRKTPADEASSNAQAANRKSERMARRELLYTVVRQAMTRAGVLSASYKFKVLSLDGRGRQFLIMIDLAREVGGDTDRLAEIEALIAQSAKSRHDILVTAVYWRMNEHVAVGTPAARQAARFTESQPIPLESQPGALEPAPVASARGPAYEPIQADEVAAFKKALVEGSTGPMPLTETPAAGAKARAFDGSGRHGPQNYILLTGYEDTEMPDPEPRTPGLSGTQHGELR